MLELVLACTTVVAAATVAGVAQQRQKAALRRLEAYAHARGLGIARSSPRGGMRTPTLEGRDGDLVYVIDVVRLEGRLCTRVSARAPRGRSVRLRLWRRDAIGTDVTDAYEVRARDASAAREAVEDAAGALLRLTVREDLWLASDGTRVVCAWTGIEPDARVLDAACEAVVRVARTHAPEAPYR